MSGGHNENSTSFQANQNWTSLMVSVLTPVTGCNRSQQAYGIYNRAERQHEFVTAILCNGSAAIAVTAYSIPALLPVSYAIFGYPGPEAWTLPLETQSVTFWHALASLCFHSRSADQVLNWNWIDRFHNIHDRIALCWAEIIMLGLPLIGSLAYWWMLHHFWC